ncbi:MAG TPA: hypothetical protein EYP14_09365 [Planctomycetaceae bacterium]|nr:hypothetical protein [Planctomycetaceae bacterium]
MKTCVFSLALIGAVAWSNLVVTAEDYRLKRLSAAPEGLPEAIRKELDPNGVKIIGPDGPVCEIWFLKQLDAVTDFQPTASIKYPFTPGQLIGVVRLSDDAVYTDFRGQEVQPGLHTIRYAQEPQDGNHFSEIRDFLLLLPAAEDTDPSVLQDGDTLSEKSKESSEGEHPTVMPLLPPGDSAQKPTLTYRDDGDLWIVNVTVHTLQNGKSSDILLRAVVVGMSEE